MTPRPSPWPAVQLDLARTVHYLGFLLLPGILFWVGLSQEDLMHAVYLALLLIQFLPSILSLEPTVTAGAITNHQVCYIQLAGLRYAHLCNNPPAVLLQDSQSDFCHAELDNVHNWATPHEAMTTCLH